MNRPLLVMTLGTALLFGCPEQPSVAPENEEAGEAKADSQPQPQEEAETEPVQPSALQAGADEGTVLEVDTASPAAEAAPAPKTPTPAVAPTPAKPKPARAEAPKTTTPSTESPAASATAAPAQSPTASAPKTAAEAPTPAPTTTAAGAQAASGDASWAANVKEPTKKAQRTWKAKCASCHGMDGKGQTKKGREMKVSDLSQPALQAKRSDAQLREAIAEGVDETENGVKKEMAAFKDELSAAQLDEMVNYSRWVATQ